MYYDISFFSCAVMCYQAGCGESSILMRMRDIRHIPFSVTNEYISRIIFDSNLFIKDFSFSKWLYLNDYIMHRTTLYCLSLIYWFKKYRRRYSSCCCQTLVKYSTASLYRLERSQLYWKNTCHFAVLHLNTVWLEKYVALHARQRDFNSFFFLNRTYLTATLQKVWGFCICSPFPSFVCLL